MISKDLFGNPVITFGGNRLLQYSDRLSVSDQGATVIVEKENLQDLFNALATLYPKEFLRAWALEACCHKTRLRGAPCPVGRECPYD